MLTIPQLTEKMIAFSEGNTADIHHFLCVWAYAKTIGEAEGLDEKTQFLLEATAILHDISCPLCREKYGNTDGRYQEAESPRLVQGFLADSGFDTALIDRISFLIAHHHTVTGIDGMDYQILVEADFLVNLYEDGRPDGDGGFMPDKAAVEAAYQRIFATETGKWICRSMFALGGVS
jgi:hypothetical protein